jgi:LuxR family maltose regulon positive regulatory protein
MNGLVTESTVGFQQVVDERGPAWADTNARAGSMTFLGVLALREQRVDAAAELLDRAIALREESGITEQGLHAFSDAVATRLAVLQGGDIEAARRRLTHAQRTRSLTTWAVPSLALAVRLELVKAHLALADVAGARAVTREMADILHHRPDLGSFESEARELCLRTAEQAEAAQGPSSLTAAELRLVPWLATHLSFREIGERLYLSTNTVKTEALSTYRKLGASSRSEAVEAAVCVGLLDPASLPRVLSVGGWGTANPSQSSVRDDG